MKHPRTINDNEGLVRDLMRFSPYGGLGQVFIVEAIRNYATLWSNTTPEGRAKMQQENQLIDMETWHKIGVDVKQRCDEFYKR